MKKIIPTQDQIVKIESLYKSGLGTKKISDFVSIKSKKTIQNILEELGIYDSNRKILKSIPNEKVCKGKCKKLKAIDDYTKDKSNGNIFYDNVCKECKNEISRYKRSKSIDDEFSNIDPNIIEQMRVVAANERSHKKIAKQFNFSIKKTSKIIKLYDIEVARAPKKKLIELSNDQLIDITKLYDLGFGSNVISNRLKMKLSYVIRGFEILSLPRGQHSPNHRPIPKERTCTKCKSLKKIDKFTIFTNKSGNLTYKLVCIECTNAKNIKNCKIRKEKNAERMKSDPMFAIRDALSAQIRKMLKYRGTSKNGQSCLKFLDFTLEQLIIHIEKIFMLPGNEWMNWKNRGMYVKKLWNDNDQSTWKWQLDHVIPHSDFDYRTMNDQDFKDCWALSNLRPYSAKQNQHDGSTGIRHTKNHPNIKK